MDSTPYDAPKARDLVHDDESQTFAGTGDFDLGQCVSDAWNATTRNLGVIIGAAIVGYLLMVVATFTFIGIFLVVPPLIWGGVALGMQALDSQARFDTLWDGFRNYGRSLGRMLLLMLALMILGIIGNTPYYIGAFTESAALTLIGVLIAVVWGLAIMVRLYFAWIFAVDTNTPATDSIKASLQATKGLWFKVVLLALLSVVVAFLGFLALGVGALISVPMSYLMWGSAFRQMVGRPRNPLRA